MHSFGHDKQKLIEERVEQWLPQHRKDDIIYSH